MEQRETVSITPLIDDTLSSPTSDQHAIDLDESFSVQDEPERRAVEKAFFQHIAFEVAGFIVYLYEMYRFFHTPVSGMDLFALRFVMLCLALPVLYIFRIANFFDWGEALSFFLSERFRYEDTGNSFFQVKIFYYAIYACLSFLVIMDFFTHLGSD